MKFETYRDVFRILFIWFVRNQFGWKQHWGKIGFENSGIYQIINLLPESEVFPEL